ncbi:MAG: hypothetical protein AB7U79_06875 [Candidatus Izemoplasmatales bacterium]
MLQTINDFVQPYIDQLLSIFNGFEYYLQAAILLVIAIFVVIGLFVFLKKFIKLFIFLAIIGGVFYYVYTQTDLLDSILGSGYVTTGIKMLLFN